MSPDELADTLATMDITTVQWENGLRAPIRFRVLRIIDGMIGHVEGIGSVWFFYDFQTDRRWARRFPR